MPLRGPRTNSFQSYVTPATTGLLASAACVLLVSHLQNSIVPVSNHVTAGAVLDGQLAHQDPYNLARLPWTGRIFTVRLIPSVHGVGALCAPQEQLQHEPVPGLRVLLGEALGRTNIRFRSAQNDEAADIILLCGHGSGAFAPSHSSFSHARNSGTLVLAFDISDALSQSSDDWTQAIDIDGAFRACAALRCGDIPASAPGLAPRQALATPGSRLNQLLLGPAESIGCSDSAPAAPSGRTRRGGDAWCGAARRALLSAYVRSLSRGDASFTGRAVFLTYGSAPRYDFYVDRLISQARSSDVFADARGYTQFDIDREFKAAAPGVYGDDVDGAHETRGDGFWSWKPHLIRRTLADNGAMASGDVLLYSDAMNKIRQPPRDYVQWAGRNGTCAFQMPGLPASEWTKGAAYSALGADPRVYGPLPQITATALAIRKDPRGLFLATQWEWFAMDADAITDNGGGGVPNEPGFRDHRHDQALWSLLVYMLGAEVLRPTDETWAPAEVIDRRTRFDADGRRRGLGAEEI